MNTETPRTDAEAGHESPFGEWVFNPHGSKVRAKFARQLERELVGLRDENGRLREALRKIESSIWNGGTFGASAAKAVAQEALKSS